MTTSNPAFDKHVLAAAGIMCEDEQLFFTRYFFKYRHNIQFRVNWHHEYVSDELELVLTGVTKNLCINLPPGGTKTELAIINLIARGLAINPWCRFLHLSGSDDLALLNSQTARDLVTSEEFQALWPMEIADDSKSKKRWNVMVGDKIAGGCYATSLKGQIVGFRAGHMKAGFQGAILIDDPLKPEDAFSQSKLNEANRKLLTTVKSRRANPDTPIIIIMQRISENDPTGFIKAGNVGGEWKYITIPAVIDDAYVKTLPKKYQALVDRKTERSGDRYSYWPYKERIKDLLAMERGEGSDATGARISRHVFTSQYQQAPKAVGGNIIRGSWFHYYNALPKIAYRKIYVDTAMKTKERNDYSVFECWGSGTDGKIYLLDVLRGKWEAPELEKRALAFWAKHKASDVEMLGQLRQMVVEDKASGTGLIQKIRLLNSLPIKGIERTIDKLTRVMDVLSYIESRMVCVPETAPFTTDFISECEAFTADDSHAFDDQIDPMCDAVNDMLSTKNKLAVWEKLASKKDKPTETAKSSPLQKLRIRATI